MLLFLLRGLTFVSFTSVICPEGVDIQTSLSQFLGPLNEWGLNWGSCDEKKGLKSRREGLEAEKGGSRWRLSISVGLRKGLMREHFGACCAT